MYLQDRCTHTTMGQTGSVSSSKNGSRYGIEDSFKIHSRVDDLEERDVLETPPRNERRQAALTPPPNGSMKGRPNLSVETNFSNEDILDSKEEDAFRIPTEGLSATSTTSSSSKSQAYYNADDCTLLLLQIAGLTRSKLIMNSKKGTMKRILPTIVSMVMICKLGAKEKGVLGVKMAWLRLLGTLRLHRKRVTCFFR